jgi:putative membrane protein
MAMKSLLSQVAAAISGLWLASSFVPGVVIRIYSDSSFFGFALNAQWQILLILGILLGLLNFFVKPILNAISLPLRIITLGLFSIVISMGMIWALDLMFAELYVPWLYPLLWTTLVIWGLSIIFDFFLKNKNED